jgi:hypothetical protein
MVKWSEGGRADPPGHESCPFALLCLGEHHGLSCAGLAGGRGGPTAGGLDSLAGTIPRASLPPPSRPRAKRSCRSARLAGKEIKTPAKLQDPQRCKEQPTQSRPAPCWGALVRGIWQFPGNLIALCDFSPLPNSQSRVSVTKLSIPRNKEPDGCWWAPCNYTAQKSQAEGDCLLRFRRQIFAFALSLLS